MDSIPMILKCLCKAQPKYKLENPDSTTNYTWDLNKPINLSSLSYDIMSSLSLCKLTGQRQAGNNADSFHFKCITINVKWVDPTLLLSNLAPNLQRDYFTFPFSGFQCLLLFLREQKQPHETPIYQHLYLYSPSFFLRLEVNCFLSKGFSHYLSIESQIFITN